MEALSHLYTVVSTWLPLFSRAIREGGNFGEQPVVLVCYRIARATSCSRGYLRVYEPQCASDMQSRTVDEMLHITISCSIRALRVASDLYGVALTTSCYAEYKYLCPRATSRQRPLQDRTVTTLLHGACVGVAGAEWRRPFLCTHKKASHGRPIAYAKYLISLQT